MTRIESHLRTLAERTWRASVEARMSGDVERSRALLAESRALDARASMARKFRSDEEDRRMALGLAKLIERMDELKDGAA